MRVARNWNSSDSPTSMELVGCWLAGSLAMVIVAVPGLPAKPNVKPSGTVTGTMVSVSHHVVDSTSSISTPNPVDKPRLVTTRSITTTLFEASAMVLAISSTGSTTVTLTTPLVCTGGLPS